MNLIKTFLWLVCFRWWMNDLRRAALALLILASCAGWFFNTEAHVTITIMVVLAAAVGISLAYREAEGSGATGLFLLSVIGAFVILIPLWISHGVKAWLH